jgi:hypothetical protein
MTLQNKIEAAKYSLFLRIFLSLTVLLWLIILFIPFYDEFHFFTIAASLTSLAYLAILLRTPHYFWVTDLDKRYVTIRYYNVHPGFVKPKELKIQKGSIDEIKIISLFWGWRKLLSISIKTKNGSAKYHPINISLLNKNEIEKLKRSLNTWKIK